MMKNSVCKIPLILLIIAQAVHALDPMYDYRYTIGPEIIVPGAFNIGFGGWTHFNEDLILSPNVQVGLTKEFEMGIKYMQGTSPDWLIAKPDDRRKRNHNHSLINVGAKYAISSHSSLQADVPMAINRDMDWSGILSYTQYNGLAKNLSFMYEGRLGFGGLPGARSYTKPMASVTPFFQIGESFRVSTSVITSFSVGDMEDFKNDFMLDIIPRVEVGFTLFRLTGEIARNILTYNARSYGRIALFAVSDI